MAAPSYDPYLKFNPTFRYGGREWGVNDLEKFKRTLRSRGVSYDRWARNHGAAARVFDPVEQQMYGTFKPQLDAINYEREKSAAAAQRRMHDLAGFTQAVMGMLGTISPAVRGAYGEGAETMRAGGTGYGDVLNTNMAANAAKGNSLLDVIGSEQRLEGGDAGSVLAGVAGWLPADMMAKQGDAYGDMFAQMPKEASFQAQLQMKQLMAEAAETDSDFSNEILGILNGMPNARQELVNQRTEINLAKQEMALKRLSEERDWLLKQAAWAKANNDSKRADEYLRLAQIKEQRYQYETQGRDANGNLMPGYRVDPKTGYLLPPNHMVDKNGNVVKVSSSSGRSKYTASQRAEMVEKIDEKEEDIKAMIATAVQNGDWRPSQGNLAARRKLGNSIFQQFLHLAGTPSAKKRLRNLIGKLLRDAGKIGPPAPGAAAGAAGSGSTDDGSFFAP